MDAPTCTSLNTHLHICTKACSVTGPNTMCTYSNDLEQVVLALKSPWPSLFLALFYPHFAVFPLSLWLLYTSMYSAVSVWSCHMNGRMGLLFCCCYVIVSNTPTSCPHAASDEYIRQEGRGTERRRSKKRNEWDVCMLQLVHMHYY